MLVGMVHTMPVLGALFLEGVSETGERTLVITSENRDRLPGFPEEISKEVHERFQLESFRSAYLLRFGHVPFDEVRRGGDPPDFEVTSSEGLERIDCVTLVHENRRVAYRLLDHLRTRLVEGSGDRDFSGVAGCVLSVWFGTKLSELPPRRWDDTIVNPLLDEIAGCQVDRDGLSRLTEDIARRGFPQVMPPVIATGQTSDGRAGFIANVLLAPPESVRFPSGLGFDVQLHLPQPVMATDVRQIFSRLVRSHDQPEIEHLLVVAGGPDRNGFLYPAEEAIGGFLLGDRGLVASVRHLKKVTVHLWYMREIVEIPIVRDVP